MVNDGKLISDIFVDVLIKLKKLVDELFVKIDVIIG